MSKLSYVNSSDPQMYWFCTHWVFWGGVQKKEVKKGKIVVTDVKVSTAACI
jgi:hypothetical protein